MPQTQSEQYIAEVNRLIATVNDDMQILLLRWANCMRKPRPKHWEATANELHIATRLLLGNLSAAVHSAAEAIVGDKIQ